MKIQQLRYFIEVCNCGTITEAAEKLYVSQPSITQSIKDLEQSIGTNLFRRINKRLYLTKEGEYLFANAIKIVSDVDLLKNDMQSISKNKNIIRLGLPLQVGSFLLHTIIGEFLKYNPEIKVEIVELGSYEILELLKKEELDILIMTFNEEITDTFNYINLFNSEYCFVTSIHNKLSNKETIDINDLADENLVLLEKSYNVNKFILSRFLDHRIEPNVLFYTNQLHTIKNLVKHNLASSFLSREAIDEDDDIKGVSLDPVAAIKTGIVIKKNTIVNPCTKKLIQFLTDKFSS